MYYSGLASTWAILAYLMTSDWANLPGQRPRHGQRCFAAQLRWDAAWRHFALSAAGVLAERPMHRLRLATGDKCLAIRATDRGHRGAGGSDRVVHLAIPGLGLCLGSFFLILAPTSSIVPVVDAAFEHRMYLPLASVVVVAVIAGYEITHKLPNPRDEPRCVSCSSPPWRSLGHCHVRAKSGLRR